MKNLVRRINQSVICDTYTCNNMAQFEISHEMVRAAGIQICEECLRAIVEEGSQLLNSETEISHEPLPFEEVETADTTKQTAEPTEKEKSEEKISESGKTDEPIMDAEVEKPVKVYTCKHCGAEFNDLKSYRGHVLSHSKKTKEQ